MPLKKLYKGVLHFLRGEDKANAPLKVLYMPVNMASTQALTADAVNKIPGVKAICLSYGTHKYNQPSENTIEIPIYPRRKVWHYLLSTVKTYYYFVKLIAWADVIHFSWKSVLPYQLDLKLIKWFKKPGVVEWVGSDVRCPARSFPINPYLKQVFYNGYEYASIEDDHKSDQLQEQFKELNFYPLCGPEIQLYIKKGLFETIYTTYQRIAVKEFTPSYPDVNNKRPVIVHTPSAKIAKGTNIIIPVMEALKLVYDFEFMLVHDMARSEALKIMSKADVFLDAIICGGYGSAAVEAMSFGKPVMCYIMPAVYQNNMPENCPIVSTNPDNLKENLIQLITNPQLRNELGFKSRQFVEANHDIDKLAPRLVAIYREVMEKQKRSYNSQYEVSHNVVSN